MKKIEKLIENIKDENISTSSLLREAKILANDLDQAEFLSWINLELEGYKNNDSYPSYRNLNGQIKAWNPYYGWIPVIHKNPENERMLSKRRTKQSIGEIEELLSQKSSSYEMPYSDSVANQILKGPYRTKASFFIDRSSLAGVLNAVKDNLLDWAIRLKKQGIEGGDVEFTPEEKEKARKIESKYAIGNIEKFQGSIGDWSQHAGKLQVPRESFWSKFFWYVLVALIVVIIGNIISELILKYMFGDIM
ncbi:MAG: hypothetical protein ACKKMW_01215 [Candidatus Nealsonbacteria bacterium]